MNFDLNFLLRRIVKLRRFDGNAIPRIFDTLVASRVAKNNKSFTHVDPNGQKAHSLKVLARECLGENQSVFEKATGGVNISIADLDKVLKYNIADAEITLKVID
jgi:hypothetical protein